MSEAQAGAGASAHLNGGSTLRASVRLAAILILTAGMAVPVLSLNLLRSRWRHHALQQYYRWLASVCGLRVECNGEPRHAGPVLYVANHVSYLDIILLGTSLRASFVSKAEVQHWPAIGWLAKQVGTTFIERRVRLAAGHVGHLAERLERGDSLVLFPEGTATDGTGVLPFKSTLFAALASGEGRQPERQIEVQPVSLLYYARKDGAPLDYGYRGCYAWFGDDETDGDFAAHAWQMLRMPGLKVRLNFHQVLSVDAQFDRKALARDCESIVAAPVAALAQQLGAEE